MRNMILAAMLGAALAAPAAAATYPVSGQFGQSTGDKAGTIDCSGKRTVSFSGSQRTDTGGSVRQFQNSSVIADGPSQYRIVDSFSNGLVHNGHVSYTLRQIDQDRIVVDMQGGSVTFQRCK